MSTILQNKKLQKEANRFLRPYTLRGLYSPDAPLEERARGCIIALRFAAKATSEASVYLKRCALDAARSSAIDECLAQTDELGYSLWSYLEKMPAHARCYDQLAFLVELCAVANPEEQTVKEVFSIAGPKKGVVASKRPRYQPLIGVSENKGKGRPANPYLQETEDLIGIYEKVTGKAATQPRLHEGDPVDELTVFIYDCLQKIDKKITPRFASTCIRNVLKARQSQIAKHNDLKETLDADLKRVRRELAAEKNAAMNKLSVAPNSRRRK